MNRLIFIVAIVVLLMSSTTLSAQSVARLNVRSDEAATASGNAKAITALKSLESDVIVYRSLGDFEDSGKLARVSLLKFEQRLSTVTRELEPMLDRMPASKLKFELTNALDSFRDGAFYWRQADQPRVVNISALSYAESNRTQADSALLATTAYTVAIHWRQAHTYLN